MGRFDYEKKATRWNGPGKPKGSKVNKGYRGNLCKHANNPSDCNECIREANAARAHNTRIVNRAKRVKKAKKKKKSGSTCSIIALLLLGTVGAVGWGLIEIVGKIIG